MFARILSAIIGVSLFSAASLAQDGSVELLDRKRPDKSARPIVLDSGPITTISAAGLLIATFDLDEDYSVNRLEYESGYKAAFLRADTDKNGRLGLVELNIWREQALGAQDATPGSMFFDTDYSQTTTREEFDDAFERIFRMSDFDKNGAIEFTEIVRVVTPRKPQSQPKRERQSVFDQQRRRLAR